MTGEGGRLPVVLPPDTDERLSSWLARLAVFYAMSVPEFLAKLGLKGRNVFDLEWRLSEGEGVKIVGRTGLSENKLQAMTFREIVPEARIPNDCPKRPAPLPALEQWMFSARNKQQHFHGHLGVRFTACITEQPMAATLAEMFAGEQLTVLGSYAEAAAFPSGHLRWSRGARGRVPGVRFTACITEQPMERRWPKCSQANSSLFLAPMPRQVQAFWPLGRGAKSRATWGRLKCLHS